MPMSAVSSRKGTGSADAATASRIARPRSRLWMVGVSCVDFPFMAGRSAGHRIPLLFGLDSTGDGMRVVARDSAQRARPRDVRMREKERLAHATLVAYSAQH